MTKRRKVKTMAVVRLTISEYVKMCYEQGIDTVDAFFDETEYGYIPADSEVYRQNLVDTLDDMYGELLIDRQAVALSDIKDYVHNMIIKAHKRYAYTIKGLWDSTLLDGQYDPLDNVNEIWTDTRVRTPNLTDTDSGSQTIGPQTSGNTHDHKVNTFNDATLVNDSQDIDSSNSSARTDTSGNTHTATGTETITYERRRHGNIGVTTSGQLIADYRGTHMFNMYEVIASLIAGTFTRGYC